MKRGAKGGCVFTEVATIVLLFDVNRIACASQRVALRAIGTSLSKLWALGAPPQIRGFAVGLALA
jgi:hypothetical protein